MHAPLRPCQCTLVTAVHAVINRPLEVSMHFRLYKAKAVCREKWFNQSPVMVSNIMVVPTWKLRTPGRLQEMGHVLLVIHHRSTFNFKLVFSTHPSNYERVFIALIHSLPSLHISTVIYQLTFW